MTDYKYFAVQIQFDSVEDTQFRHIVFQSRPALFNKKEGICQVYGGEEYDKAEFDLVDGMWDHEHCDICGFSIREGYTCWVNTNNVNILCDECYDHFVEQNKAVRTNR